MAEETKDPVTTFPRIMLTGLSITGLIYVLVSITAVALVPIGRLADTETPLLTVVETGAPDLPIDDIYPFGERCNAEYRSKFATHLHRTLSPERLRQAWIFLSARRRSDRSGFLTYHRLVRFESSARTPPARIFGIAVISASNMPWMQSCGICPASSSSRCVIAGLA